MNTTRYYKVAEHVMAVKADETVFSLLDNCLPFEVDPTPPLIQLDIRHDVPLPEEWTEEWRQTEEGDEIACGHIADEPSFIFFSKGLTAGWMTCSTDYRHARLSIMSIGKLAVDNAMMVSFALATALKDTLLFHSSVVCRNGKAYMFLGPSGTGKSTHTRLWLKYIEGSSLLNDDNPVVRIGDDGKPVVYGSPWSGKTPCYLNEKYPLGGVVMLTQAPHNTIRQLQPIEAYAVMSSSVSGKRWDKSIADGLHHTLNILTQQNISWYMECLPDEEAARITSSRI